MKGFVGTVLSGAIGLAALYVVGKIAFQAGHDIAKAECKYEQLQRGISAKTAKPETSDEEEEKSIPEETRANSECCLACERCALKRAAPWLEI